MDTVQIKYAFDSITKSKILKGALIALSGSAAIGLLNYIGQLPMPNPQLVMLVAWLIPTLINIVKEWMAGTPK